MRIDEAVDCSGSYDTFGDMVEMPLFYEGTHVCEYEDVTHEDAETGEEYCYNTQDCIPEQWGYLDTTKIITNGTESTIGDTVTYCLTVTNTSGSSVTFDLWDTLPEITSFVDCDNGCTNTTYGSREVVHWEITLASDASATRCFWVTVDSYPYFILHKEYFARCEEFLEDHNLYSYYKGFIRF